MVKLNQQTIILLDYHLFFYKKKSLIVRWMITNQKIMLEEN
jgi:hypothetical protein